MGPRQKKKKKLAGHEAASEMEVDEAEKAVSGIEGALLEIDLPEDDEAETISGDDCEVDDDGDINEANDEETNDEGGNGREIVVDKEAGDLEGDGTKNSDSESYADSGDDVWNDDRIPYPYSSEDDEEEAHHLENEESDVKLFLGRTFSTADEFKLTLLHYSLKTKYDIKLYLSSALKLGAKCSDPKKKCEWRVYCSYERRKQKLMIKCLVDKHTCLRSVYSSMLKISTIAKLFTERLRVNPKLTKYEMAAEIKREYGHIVTPDQCGKARTKVVKGFRKSHEEHFSRIWDYQAEILRSNPSTTMDIETIPGPTIGSTQRFYRLYVCFEAERESWKKTCRPIIGLDGAFLKWDIKGQLLAAVGRAGDNRIVPIAWAVVEIENDTNWDWFVRHISRDLGLNDGRDIAILSDKQKGLVKAIHNVLPLAEHRQCCRHIYDNWKKDSRDLRLQKLFWKIARSYTPGYFSFHMEELKKYNQGAYDSLLITNHITWSRAYFRMGSCCNDNLNNLCESFNKTIREARRKPLLDMLEDIRRQCMVRNAKRAIIASRLKTEFTKRAHVEIEKMKYGSKDCSRYMAVGDTHEVDHGEDRYSVDMVERTCGCMKWQMTGIPCIHATCVITTKKQQIEDFVSHFYTTTKWRETYSYGIRPVQRKKLWPQKNRLPVLPPPWRNNLGRPKNHARRKGANETVPSSNNTKLKCNLRVMTCSRCKQEGHNVLTCKNTSVENPPKRPRGRPRKYQVEILPTSSQVQNSQVQESQFLGSQGWEQNSQGTQEQRIPQGWDRWFSSSS